MSSFAPSVSSSAAVSATVVFCDFLEAAIQTVLYVRRLYPEAAFVRRRGFGRLLHCIRHPLLRSYIAQLVHSVRLALGRWRETGGGGGSQGSAAALKFVLVVFDPSQQRCLERYVFDCRLPSLPSLPSPPPLHTAGPPGAMAPAGGGGGGWGRGGGGRGGEALPAAGGAEEAGRAMDTDALASLRSQLSDALSKLSLCNSLLTALPDIQPPCTFTLLLYTNTAQLRAPPADPDINAVSSSPSESSPSWLPVELSGSGPASTLSTSPLESWLVEIRSIRSPLLECEFYVTQRMSESA